MAENLQEKIKEKEMKKEKLINEMDDIKNDLLKEINNFAKEWFLLTARDEVSSYPKRAYSIGTDQLKELKQGVLQLREKSEDFVENYLNVDQLWWHLNENNKDSYYAYENRLMDDLDKQIKRLFGELGKLLSKYEIVNVMINGSFEQGSWVNEFDTVRYAYSIRYPDLIYKLNKKYVDAINKGQKINEELKRLTYALEKSKVAELWDSL